MSNPSSGRPRNAQQSSAARADTKKSLAEATAGAFKDIADQTKEAAADTATTLGYQVKSLLNDQVGHSAEVVGRFANATQRAADELEQESPQVARLVRGVADHLDNYADDLRDQSVEELVQAASNYTRRQPAVVFGLAALAGFFALRTFKSAALSSSRSNQAPTRHQFQGETYDY
jgi:gas vesicle protein